LTSSADLRRRRVAGSRRRPPAAERPPAERHGAQRPGKEALAERPVKARLVKERAVKERAEKGRRVKEPPVMAAPAEEPSAGRRRSRRLWPAAIASGLALAALGATLAYSLPARLTDADRAAAVGSARTTLESLLSYRGADFDAHVAQVTPQLTSPFREQFATVASTDIKPLAVKNAATVQAKVYEAGVMTTTGDGAEGSSVRVLAFVNQATTSATQKTPAIDQNRVIATMRKVGDRWLVSELSAF
jgi:Mce-associated membrane protein